LVAPTATPARPPPEGSRTTPATLACPYTTAGTIRITAHSIKRRATRRCMRPPRIHTRPYRAGRRVLHTDADREVDASCGEPWNSANVARICHPRAARREGRATGGRPPPP